MVSRNARLIVLVLGVLAQPAHAQDSASVGARVRVTIPALGRSAGLLLASTGDSLLIGSSRRATRPLAVARADVTMFERSAGGDAAASAARGVQIGIAAGAVVFGMHHLITRRSGANFAYDFGDLAFASLNGAAVGVIAGGVAGIGHGRERWDTVPLPAANVAVLPNAAERVTLQTRMRLARFAHDAPIRVHTYDGGRIEGRYLGLDDGDVRIAAETAQRVAIAGISDIDERRPLTEPWLRGGLWIGGLIGAAFVAVGALTDTDECPPDFCVDAWPILAVPITVGGAFTGATIGAIVGSYVKGWRPQRW